MNFASRVLGTGCHLPERKLTNKDFETFLETSDEWIRSRTGIEERRICDPERGENTLWMAFEASKKVLESCRIAPSELDLIVVGTVTPDTVMPTTANQLQAKLQAHEAFSFDLQAACSGFIYGLSIADQFIQTGKVKKALVIGVEMLSSILNYRDRSTCVLFGDAAGAFIIERTEASASSRIIDIELFADGNYGESLCIPHGYSRVPPLTRNFRFDHTKVMMKGSDIFKLAVRYMVESSQNILAKNNLTLQDIELFVFHQANIRIIDHCAKTLGIPQDKMWINVHKYGNTSSATLPICVDEALRSGRIKRGDKILMTTFGGGVTWGAALIEI